MPSVDKIYESITLLPDLEHLDPEKMLPSLDETTNMLKNKCKENGGPDAYDEAISGKDEMIKCFQNIVNVTELQKEMELAKPTGDLDIVFSKYCRRTPDLKNCIGNYTQSIEKCLSPKEQENLKIVMNITHSLLEFTCFKDGDRIALFISNTGPECFKEKQADLMDCLNSTYADYAPKDKTGVIGVANITFPSLLFGLKECQDIEKLQMCSVKKLEFCENPTPANILESLFDYIKKATPCMTILKEAKSAARISDNNTATNIYATVTTLIMLLMTKFV